jgi:ferredoxin
MPAKPPSTFDLMDEESEAVNEDEERKQRRKELIEPTGVRELFKDGKITINKFTCVGAQCKICIQKCPTNALYWSVGEVGIIDDLCIYCDACVVNCMVDDCIKIERIRDDKKTERFSKLDTVIKMNERKNTTKRFERVKTNAITLRRAQPETLPQREKIREKKRVIAHIEPL